MLPKPGNIEIRKQLVDTYKVAKKSDTFSLDGGGSYHQPDSNGKNETTLTVLLQHIAQGNYASFVLLTVRHDYMHLAKTTKMNKQNASPHRNCVVRPDRCGPPGGDAACSQPPIQRPKRRLQPPIQSFPHALLLSLLRYYM